MDLLFRVARAVSIAAMAIGIAACGDEDADTAQAAEGDNRAPVISGSLPPDVLVNEPYEFTPSASDPDGDSLVFGVDGKPAWLDFDSSSGRLFGEPGTGDVGMHRGIVVWVSDGHTESLLPSADIEVRAAAELVSNQAPEIAGAPAGSVTAGEFYDFIPVASDDDGDTLSFSIENAPGWAQFDRDIGRLSGTPGVGDVGSYGNIVIRVSDGLATSALDPFVIVVNPPPSENSAPIISGQPPSSVLAGESYTFTPTASDADGDPLSFSVISLPAWASFDSQLGTLSGVPGTGDVGTYTGISIVVSDGEASAALTSFSIEVVSPNEPPTIGGTPDDSVIAGDAYSFVPTANDPDSDPLSFSVAGLPSWAAFDPQTGAIGGTPGDADVGLYTNISITVTDGTAEASLGPFSIEVAPVGTGTATLTWNPPTERMDGSPLADLAGFVVYWGTASGSYTDSVTLENPGLTSYVVENLEFGSTYYFAATAYDSVGLESNFSNELSQTIQ